MASSATASSPSTPDSPSALKGERDPLLRPKAPRNVTFNANPVSKTIDPDPISSLSSSPGTSTARNQAHSTGMSAAGPSGPPILAALNTRLRRRNSHGAVFTQLPPAVIPKIGPQRSTKKAEKLKLLPNPEFGDEGPDEESGRDVYSQYTRIRDPLARRDAARLGKADRDRLPRVTAYCTANKYQMEGLMRFLKNKTKSRGANPKLIDECLYSPYNYGSGKGPERREPMLETHEEAVEDRPRMEADETVPPRPGMVSERRHSTGDVDQSTFRREDLIDLGVDGVQPEHLEELPTPMFATGRDENRDLSYPMPMGDGDSSLHGGHHHEGDSSGYLQQGPEHDLDFDTTVHTPEVFLFDYGVVVIWGMSLAHEERFLKDIAKFESEKLDLDDVETECFNFYYTREYQARIYNDFITLRDKNNYMIKLAISHALAQSVKTSLFEELIASTIETCKDIPTQIALTGKIALSRQQINMQIGELFILRINIHLNGSVLDTPELFWVEPHLEPVYQAVRSYLEMDQRVGLLTERLDVIADLLAVLKDQLSHGHDEMLEWIVIILIAAEILVAAVNIVVDLYAGVD